MTGSDDQPSRGRQVGPLERAEGRADDDAGAMMMLQGNSRSAREIGQLRERDIHAESGEAGAHAGETVRTSSGTLAERTSFEKSSLGAMFDATARARIVSPDASVTPATATFDYQFAHFGIGADHGAARTRRFR